MATASREGRNVSRAPVQVASGRFVAPGSSELIDPNDPHDLALLNEGVFVYVETDAKEKAQ